MERKVEHLVIPFSECKVHEQKAGQPLRFTGYASTFGNIDKGGDIMIAGAFTETLATREHDVRMLWNHDSYSVPIGKWTLLEEDEHGLKVEGELTPGIRQAEDVAAAMRHGTIDRLSIGYITLDDEMPEEGTRWLKKVSLLEISPVNFPMNVQAAIASIKSHVEDMETLKDAERLLRDAAGFSGSAATAYVSRLKRIARSEFEAEAKQENEAINARQANTAKALQIFESFTFGE